MISKLAAHHSKSIAFLIAYTFFISGLCSFVYGRPVYNDLPNRKYYEVNGYLRGEPKKIEPKRLEVKKEDEPKRPLPKLKEEKKKTDIGGPSQPEMGAFKPVGADNMVDPFTGDFSYNIPLLDVGGYPVNIFYNSGISMDQEASWVGLGWNINPGTITRNMRGLPDDFDGSESITKEQYMKPDKTWGVNIGAGVEVIGFPVSLDVNGGIFFNNKRGVGMQAGINPALSIGGINGDPQTAPLTLGWGLNANSQSGGSTTFSIALKDQSSKGLRGSFSASIGTHSRQGLQDLHLSAGLRLAETQKSNEKLDAIVNSVLPQLHTSISFAYPAWTPSMRSRISSRNVDIDLKAGFAFEGGFAHGNLGGYYSEQWIKIEDMTITQPAFGMLYLKKAEGNQNALLDFNRLNDGMYTPGSPAISVPAYTYDVFGITGEGTGGSFRAYRGDLGFVEDAYTEVGGTSDHLGIDLGGGNYGHGGINYNNVLTPNSSGGWQRSNLARDQMRFSTSNMDTQSVYFKNPGEKAIPDVAWQNAIGGEDLVRLKFSNTGFGSPTILPSFVRYDDMLNKKTDLNFNWSSGLKKRDKRTQVISFLTAYEADRVGLNRAIKYIPLSDDSSTVSFGCYSNAFSNLSRVGGIRKANHISEVDVLMPDGRKYVYDVPVYNISQKEVTFNVTGSGSGTGSNNPIVSYTDGTHNSPGENNIGKDGYVETQKTPAYAHSFLLGALISPNYVDVKGDGITEDDMGDAIKFNYSKAANPINWKTPAGDQQANLSEGLKTDRDDDKAHYIYGQREQWYLYSIESKNMVARFYVKSLRKDSRAVIDEKGAIDINTGAYRLSKISLYTKGELLKNPSNPKPVKTVHFVYDYSLCGNNPNNSGVSETYSSTNINSNKGKLTLKAIYFSYNGNERTKKNFYKFYYPSDGGNPDYSFTANDRWGNYKADASNGNPGSLNNADFPYTPSDETKANDYAKAWTMNKVTLPSGADINIDYESDDYAYVQDRRASKMTTITGFGTSTSSSGTSNLLYSGNTCNDVLYLTVPRAITGSSTAEKNAQIKEWYLGNMSKTNQLLMKLAVNMPSDARGSGFELIPVYADIIEYGLVPSTTNIIYLRVRSLISGYTPMVHYALQFLKSNLPSKAYPAYDVSESGGLRAVVKALDGLYTSFAEIIRNGMKQMISEKYCKTVDLSKSFIRLTDPYLSKKGGGIRVKKVSIKDNFNKMTNTGGGSNNGMIDATYGTEYFYTKQELVNGTLETISSGVASWEPSIGAEENPHRQAREYYNKTPMADYDYSVMEMPVTEMFYPSASVGYCRIESRSIHRDTVKNAAGITVQEFYTTREFPTTTSFTLLSENNAKDQYKTSALKKILAINSFNNVALSQGFKVDLNDMNGKLKKQSTYSPTNLNDPIAYTENFYSMTKSGQNSFKLNNSFPVIAGADGKVVSSIIGREIELMTDFRQHDMQTITTNINTNVDLLNIFGFAVPVPSVWKPYTKEHVTYRSATTMKVVNHFAILDSVVAVDKGSMVSTKNLVYDAETGDPLLTRTNNEQNKPVYSFSYPAHWAYSGMDMAYKNIDVLFNGLTFRRGKMDPTPAANLSLLESGDELYVVPATTWKFTGGVTACEPQPLTVTPAKKIWAINTGKAGSATPEWIFIDADGNPFTASDVNVRIIRSGKRNMGSASLGNIVSLNTPVNPSTGQLEFADATNILSVSAVTYKDHWRVDNSFYVFDSIVNTPQYGRIKCMIYPAIEAVSIWAKYNSKKGFFSDGLVPIYDPARMDNYKQWKEFQNHTDDEMTDNWLRFNLTPSLPPTNATLYRTKLSLASNGGQENRIGNIPMDKRIVNNVPIYRMTTPWPTGTSTQKQNLWQQIFRDEEFGRNLHDWTNPFSFNKEEPSGISASSNKSYMLKYVSPTNTVDDRINVNLSSMQQMINDARNNSNTAIRTMIARNGFGGGITQYGKHPETHGFQRFNFNGSGLITPLLQVYYYVCGDTSTSNSCQFVNPDPELYTPNASINPSAVDTLAGKIILCNIINERLTECRSKFTQRKSINPYVEGVWGNWRPDTSFVYYGDRLESTVVDGSPVDLRKGGTITNFKKFWNFSATAAQYMTRNYAGSDVWVWNSTITQYNRKGYEIENKDPLGRFNAGLYGYSQQLPIAVINNSRYMESFFDGFEDYDYQSSSCTENCKPRRHVNMGTIDTYLDATQKHSGKMSLKVNAGQAFTFYAPISDTNSIKRGYIMRVKMDSTSVTDTVITPVGNGLRGRYKQYSRSSGQHIMTSATNALNTIDATYTQQRTDPNVNLGTGASQYSPPFSSWPQFVARWEGYILPEVTGTHQFQVSYNDGAQIYVNNVMIADGWTTANSGNNVGTVTLTKGQPVSIKINYWNGYDLGSVVLSWKRPDRTGFELVPQSVLYTPDKYSVAQAAVTITTKYCSKLDSVNVRGNALTDTFTLVQNRKMLVGAWVKVGGNDCKCSTYVNNKIKISYTGSSTTAEFTPAGSIIEGWQRYEAVFTVPASATKLKVELMNTGGENAAWFDDLRIHPFNANMKSFVYHPQNLRLMAELDENNYASFYEYDNDGTLSRVKKETVKGIKTITETRSHLQKTTD